MTAAEFRQILAQRFGTSASPTGQTPFAARLAELGHVAPGLSRSIVRWAKNGPPSDVVVILRLMAQVDEWRAHTAKYGFGHAVNWAMGYGLPTHHLHANHYDTLLRAGARLDGMTRWSPPDQRHAMIEEEAA